MAARTVTHAGGWVQEVVDLGEVVVEVLEVVEVVIVAAVADLGVALTVASTEVDVVLDLLVSKAKCSLLVVPRDSEMQSNSESLLQQTSIRSCSRED